MNAWIYKFPISNAFVKASVSRLNMSRAVCIIYFYNSACTTSISLVAWSCAFM